MKLMARNQSYAPARYVLAAAATLAAAIHTTNPAAAQDRRGRIDVEHYTIDAEIDPRTQTVAATVQVRFVPSDNMSSASFELNNALNLSKIADAAGRQIPASRSQQNSSVSLSFPEGINKGQALTLTFSYDGKLTGQEESPVYGIKFASIQNDHAYLMYPARWFPINEYTADRYSAELRITVPTGYKVLAGIDEQQASKGDKITYAFKFNEPSFPGSIAIVQGDPVRVASQGVTTSVYFRTAKDMANPYGEETGKVLGFLTSVLGPAPRPNITLVETDAGTPNGYSAQGLIFLSPRAIGTQVNPRLVANQVSRQWFGTVVSPVSRNHMWLQNGPARYAELMYIEHQNGPGALETEIRDTYIEALTLENIPVIQSGRLEDYSPEFWAATAGKGAAVLNMLRYVIGNDPFNATLKAFITQNAWKSASTDNFRQAAEQASGQKLDYFFLQWIESSGAPELKLEYTTFRTSKGFRVMGKVSQDLDLFRMPVEMRIETEGNPEEKKVEVAGTSSEFVVETFGKPKRVVLDPNNRLLRYSPPIRVAVAIRKGEQLVEIGEFTEALKEYQKALDVNRNSSLAHYRVGEVFMLQNNYQSAANEFRESLNGDLEPKWTEVWAHINLGKIFDITGQRERAVNEYRQAIRTKDNSQNAQEEASKYLNQPYERPRSTN
jgi:tetratricopeptide (TPR) repeat protein